MPPLTLSPSDPPLQLNPQPSPSPSASPLCYSSYYFTHLTLYPYLPTHQLLSKLSQPSPIIAPQQEQQTQHHPDQNQSGCRVFSSCAELQPSRTISPIDTNTTTIATNITLNPSLTTSNIYGLPTLRSPLQRLLQPAAMLINQPQTSLQNITAPPLPSSINVQSSSSMYSDLDWPWNPPTLAYPPPLKRFPMHIWLITNNLPIVT